MSFLSKKSWHAKSSKNQAKVREAEAQAAEEAKRTEQRRRELQEEKEMETLRKLNAKAGGTTVPERLEWMYQTPVEARLDEKRQDEYLLGKRMPDEKGDNVIKQVQEASGSLLVKPASTGTSMSDLKAKLRDDPLMLIKMREAEHLRSLSATQAHLHRMREQDLEDAHKHAHREEKDSKRDRKDKHRHRDQDKHKHKHRHHSRDAEGDSKAGYGSDEERRRRDKKRRRSERHGGRSDDERSSENGGNRALDAHGERHEERGEKIAKRSEGEVPRSSSSTDPSTSRPRELADDRHSRDEHTSRGRGDSSPRRSSSERADYDHRSSRSYDRDDDHRREGDYREHRDSYGSRDYGRYGARRDRTPSPSRRFDSVSSHDRRHGYDDYRRDGYDRRGAGERDYRGDHRGGGHRRGGGGRGLPEMSEEERARRLAEMTMNASELEASRRRLVVESKEEHDKEQMEHMKAASKANADNLQVDFIAQMNHDAIKGTSVEDRVSRGRFYMEKGD